MTLVYIRLMVSDEWLPFLVFVTVMTLASTAALVAESISSAAIGRQLLALSAAIFAVVGLLGFMTIGVPFLVAAASAAIGYVRLDDPQNARQMGQSAQPTARHPRQEAHRSPCSRAISHFSKSVPYRHLAERFLEHWPTTAGDVALPNTSRACEPAVVHPAGWRVGSIPVRRMKSA
jgi:hypothetical protein